MDVENPILCMEHCRNQKIFGFQVPSTCRTCGMDLTTSDLRIPPFRVPSPFREAVKTPCSIVLKPTTGDFLTDYKNLDNLHIGVTSSKGIVYEYDIDGLQNTKTASWTRSLTIRDLNKVKNRKNLVVHDKSSVESWNQYWDFTLDVVAGQSAWTNERYDERTHNCYTFVLSFIRALQTPELSRCARDRGNFCEEVIIPKTATAAKYITLYRQLVAEKVSKVSIS